MSNNLEIERYVKDPSLLIDLCREVMDQLDADNDDAETTTMDAQLREISKAVEKLEKQGIAVPDVLRAEKTRLASVLSIQTESLQILNQLADDFGEILSDLKSRIGHDMPAGAKRKRSVRSPKTPKSVLRKLIVTALQRLGGSATKGDVLKAIEQEMNGKFLPGDLEWRKATNDYVWQNNVAWARLMMIEDGIMKSNSPRGLWELEKDRK